MKWDELIKLISIALAIIASLVSGNKMSSAKIEKYDVEIIELQKDAIRLKAEIDILKFMIKDEGDD